MQKVISLITSIVLTSSALAAECPKPVQYVLENEKVNCTGYLFSPAKEAEMRFKNEDYKALLEQTKLYLEQIDNLKQQVATIEKIAEKEKQKAELWRSSAEQTTERYISLQERTNFRDYVFLVSGVGLTVLAAWSLGQVNN